MTELYDFEKQKYLPASEIHINSINVIQTVTDLIIISFKSIVYTVIGLLMVIKNLLIKTREKNIEGQLALITGGGNGLGKLISLELAKLGCNVAVIDVDINGAEQTAKDAQAFGIKAKAYKVDISDYKSVENLQITIENDLGPVDILINNAALVLLLPLFEGTPDDIERIVKVNLTSHFWTVRVFMKGMIERRKGHIVAIASIAALEALGRAIGYTATKFGVRGFMDALYEDMVVDDLKNDIHLTTVFPYFMATQQQIVNVLQSRFGNINLLTVADVTKATIDGILRNTRYVTIPIYYRFLLILLSLCPIELRDMYQQLFKPRSIK